MVAVHWPGNKYEHLMLAGGAKTLCGLLIMPGASGLYIGERGDYERLLCVQCGEKLNEAQAIADNAVK